MKERSASVLIVEDDEMFRDLLVRMFALEGFRVRDVGSPWKAIELIRRIPEINFAYIDINYDNTLISGFELAKELKRLKGNELSFMIMSMSDHPDHHWLSKKFGALGFVEKSYECIETSIKYIKRTSLNLSNNCHHQVFNCQTVAPHF